MTHLGRVLVVVALIVLIASVGALADDNQTTCTDATTCTAVKSPTTQTKEETSSSKDATSKDNKDNKERPPLFSSNPSKLKFPLPYQVAENPRIFVIDDLFSREECQQLIDLGKDRLKEAGIMGSDGNYKDNGVVRKSRDSDTLGLVEKDGEIVSIFRERMANVAMMPRTYGETLQLTRYKVGQYYDPHFDSSQKVGRLVTVLVFLNDVEEGGHLSFPWAKTFKYKEDRGHLDGILGTGRDVKELIGVMKEPYSETVCTEESNALLIKPKVGRVAVFFNHMPDLKRESYRAMHCGCPVIKGEKFVTQLWFDWFKPGTTNEFELLVRKAMIDRWQQDPFDLPPPI